MRSSKIATLIAMTMTITAVMFFLKSGVIEKADKGLRTLVTQAQIDKICNAAISDPSTNYTTYFKNLTAQYSNYTDSVANYSTSVASIFSPKPTNDSLKLIEYIKTGDQQLAIDYGWQRASPYLVFIFFAVFSLLCWFFYCGCCCCPCFCCKKSENDGCCKFVSVIISLTGFTGVIIGCIIGFAYSSKFVNSLNGTTCSFLLFYNDVTVGETKTTFPKWIGINSITKTLSDTQTALDKIAAAFPTAFSDNSWANSASKDFENKLTTSYTSYSASQLTNPNPATSLKAGVSKITPLYISAYGDYKTSGTALNLIFQEYSTLIKGSITLLDEAKTYTTNVNAYMSDIKSTLTNIQNNVNTMTSAFNSISTDVLDKWIDAQDQANNNGVSAFLVLFAILIAVSALSVLFLILLVFCNCKCFRFFLHIFWNIITILMILTFLLGGVFGIIGIIGTDGVSVMKWIFGSENLTSTTPKIITSTTTAGYINTCINGDGDLSKTFIPANSNSNNLDKLYQVSFTLSQTRDQIKNYTKSQAVSRINAQYNSMINDITLTTSGAQGNNDITAILNEYRGWTDSSLSKYQKGCSPSSQDVWAQSKDKCLNDYSYVANGGKVGDKNCVLIPEFSGATASTRYATQTGCTGGSTDFATVALAANAYITSLNQYINDNKALLNQLIANNNNIDTNFSDMNTQLLASLNKISGVIDPLVALFQNIVGNNGLFKLINCGFMRTDLYSFYDQLQNNLASNASSIGGIIIAVSFLQAIAIFFLLIVLLKNSGAAAEESAKTESNAVLKSA